MKAKREKESGGGGGEDRSSVRLQIARPPPGLGSNSSDSQHPRGSFFEPQQDPSVGGGTPAPPPAADENSAPEKKITLFALRLAVLEKAASGLGTLCFIWATVVLLGGFAILLETKDFWYVTAILVVESSRIFGRSHELEWQHRAATWTIADAGRYSFSSLVSSSRALFRSIKAVFRPISTANSGKRSSRRLADDIRAVSQQRSPVAGVARTWRPSEIPLLPYVGWVFLSKNISLVLQWLQVLAALACMALSVMRLVEQDYGDSSSDESKNKPAALNVFYALAVAESATFLTEKAYWEWKIGMSKILHQVNQECGLGGASSGEPPIIVKRFFYDAYSSCINGSIFDGAKMDLVSFAEDLLCSNSHSEQLMGVRILRKLAADDRISGEMLRKIGTSNAVMERLIEMLNWKSPVEEEIRRSAADILSKLSGRRQNALRVAGIPGAMESISSLLYTGRKSGDTRPFEVWERSIVADRSDYEYSVFNLMGLQILKRLAEDHDNCWKIGNSRGLLSKIIDFTSDGERILRNDHATETQIRTVKRSLQVVRMLAGATGQTGKALRREITDVVFTVSNIREILEHGDNHIVLQGIGIEILTSLAMDEEAREAIGATGRVIGVLLGILCKQRITEYQDQVSSEAGEALAMLTLQNRENCGRVLCLTGAVEKLLASLGDPVIRVNSSRILRNLCAYSEPGSAASRIRESPAAAFSAAFSMLLNSIMADDGKLLEGSVGLAAELMKLMSSAELDGELEKARIGRSALAEKLVQILERHHLPRTKVPRIRRFVVEAAIVMMRMTDGEYAEMFERAGMEEALRGVVETTSELECFSIFSGSVGLGRHAAGVGSIVDTALELMKQSRR